MTLPPCCKMRLIGNQPPCDGCTTKHGRLVLTIGLPGSGKSYWADAQVAADPENVVKVERDEVRFQVTGDRRNHTQELEVTDVCHVMALDALRAGKTVIVSDTNLRARYRREWADMARQAFATYEERSFLDVPLEVCLERNAARPDPVPDDVMRRMAQTAGVR